MKYNATIIGKKKTAKSNLYNLQYESDKIEGYSVHTLFSKEEFPLFAEVDLNVFKNKDGEFIYYIKKG